MLVHTRKLFNKTQTKQNAFFFYLDIDLIASAAHAAYGKLALTFTYTLRDAIASLKCTLEY